MAVWRYAGSLDDIWAGEMTAVNLGAADVLLCNLDGTLVAYEDRCPHLASPLSEGALDGGVLTCAAASTRGAWTPLRVRDARVPVRLRER